VDLRMWYLNGPRSNLFWCTISRICEIINLSEIQKIRTRRWTFTSDCYFGRSCARSEWSRAVDLSLKIWNDQDLASMEACGDNYYWNEEEQFICCIILAFAHIRFRFGSRCPVLNQVMHWSHRSLWKVFAESAIVGDRCAVSACTRWYMRIICVWKKPIQQLFKQLIGAKTPEPNSPTVRLVWSREALLAFSIWQMFHKTKWKMVTHRPGGERSWDRLLSIWSTMDVTRGVLSSFNIYNFGHNNDTFRRTESASETIHQRINGIRQDCNNKSKKL
jgi:hypothetical protein